MTERKPRKVVIVRPGQPPPPPPGPPPPPPPSPPPPPAPVATWPADVDPVSVLVGGAAFTDRYGFKAVSANAQQYPNMYAYFANHGGTAMQHPGIDVVAPYETKLYALAHGVVRCVGDAGQQDWGQACGAYNDTGDAQPGGRKLGVGNITIMYTDPNGGPPVKATMGHSRKSHVKPGDKVVPGQLIGTMGGMMGAHCHFETSIERNGTYWIVEPRQALRPFLVGQPIPTGQPGGGGTGQVKLPTGTITVLRPNNGQPYNLPWTNITRWYSFILEAATRYPRATVELIAAMMVIESGGKHYVNDRDGQVVQAPWDGWPPADSRATGAMQVKYPLWEPEAQALGTSLMIPRGNILTAAKLMHQWIGEEGGSWERMITEHYHPGSDPNGTSPASYVRAARQLMEAWRGQGGSGTEPVFPWPVQWVAVPGLTDRIPLPADVDVVLKLTPVGQNRPGVAMQLTGGTWHETGNRGVGTDANMHSTWQDNGTPGHPDGKVAVHVYGDDRRYVIKIPLNERGIHSGDWRNASHYAYEECVNADRNSERADRNAQAWHAGVLGWGIKTTAKEDLYPHRTGGCPAIINGRGAWNQLERGTDGIITNGKGAVPGGGGPPPPQYAQAVPIPKEWDGTDYVDEDGARYVALRRTFATAKDDVTCHQYANRDQPQVRAPLPKGEAVECYYLTMGDDPADPGTRMVPWVVSRWGSRILASDLVPSLGALVGVMEIATDVEQFADQFHQRIAVIADEFEVLDADPTLGLSGDTSKDDEPPVAKDQFMAAQV
jgi:murein DD-endopeptidase MepM/ murein hydrolase activator NlpD